MFNKLTKALDLFDDQAVDNIKQFRDRKETAREIGERFNKMEAEMERMKATLIVLQNKLNELTVRLK